jgi:hypothetical protein
MYLHRLRRALVPSSLFVALLSLPLIAGPAKAVPEGLTGPFSLDKWSILPSLDGTPLAPVGDGSYQCPTSLVSTACIDGPDLNTASTIQIGPPGGFTVVGAVDGDYGAAAGQSVDVPWTLAYTGTSKYQLDFDFLFGTPDVGSEDLGYFAINGTQLVFTSSSESKLNNSYTINPGDVISFGVYSANVDNNVGFIQITKFTATEVVDVPGPLPLMGAAAAFGWSRRLRRRVRQIQA